MSKIVRKIASVCVTLTLLAALFAPLVAPAEARSISGVSRVLVVDPDWASDDASSAGGTYFGALSELTIKEDSDFFNDFRDGDVFALSLTTGVKWVRGCYDSVTPVDGFPAIYQGPPLGSFTAFLSTNIVSDNRMEITIPNGATSGTEVDSMVIPLYVDLNGTTGDIYVTIESINSAFNNASHQFAISKGVKTTAIAGNIKNISTTGEGETIRIDETYPGALFGRQTLSLELTNGFAWDGFQASDLVVGGGFLYNTIDYDVVYENDSQTLEISIDLGDATFTKGSIYIKTPIKALTGAPTGIVQATLTGSPDIVETDLVVGWYKSPTAAPGASAADVNGDGVVNGLDLTELLKYFGS